MATFTDAEIDDILETSGTVIDSIITAQGKPAETVGRSAIPQGKTKALSTAWEKHGSVQPHTCRDTPDQPDRTDKQPTTPEQATLHDNSPATPTGPPPTQAASETGDTQLKTGASSSLLSMLDKLSNKSSNAKKGAHGRVPKKGTTNIRPSNTGTSRAMEATRKDCSTRPRPSLGAGAQTRTQHIMDNGRSHNHQLVQPLMCPSQGRAKTILLHLWIVSSYLSTLCRR
uniref:W protein n=1 Tax=Avian paramyxovirus 1 TaxID=2560319 RepID=A0A060N2W5_NCDV|nr:W [Avian orthoavulavirus 1] [avian paramyxovirus 1]